MVDRASRVQQQPSQNHAMTHQIANDNKSTTQTNIALITRYYLVYFVNYNINFCPLVMQLPTTPSLPITNKGNRRHTNYHDINPATHHSCGGYQAIGSARQYPIFAMQPCNRILTSDKHSAATTSTATSTTLSLFFASLECAHTISQTNRRVWCAGIVGTRTGGCRLDVLVHSPHHSNK